VTNLKGIGKKSREKLSQVLRKTEGIISTKKIADILEINSRDASAIASSWNKKGWLSRIKRGYYTPVSLASCSAKPVIENPWLLANVLFSPCYIGGWSAAEYWGLIEQMFQTVFIYTEKRFRTKEMSVALTCFSVKRTPEKLFFGLKNIWVGNVKVKVSDPSRTIIDFLDSPGEFGGIRPVCDVLKAYMQSEYRDLNLLLKYAEKAKNRTIFKRLGFLVDQLLPDQKTFLEQCKKRISKGKSQLDPSIKGTTLVTKWQLWIPDSWKKGEQI
jgi:predicted transcriptional regulator of viral defense system